MIRRPASFAFLLLGLAAFLVAARAATASPEPSGARSPDGRWALSYGGALDDVANGLWPTADGGLAVAGTTASFGVAGADAWVLRVNAAGTVSWSETFGAGLDEYANAVQRLNGGDLVIVGTSGSYGVGIHDYWVIRLDDAGNVLWQQTYGGTQHNHAFAIQETSDLGFIVVGETTSFGAGNRDAWVVRLDANGNVLWQTVYGRSGWDIARGVAETTDGGFVFVGYTSSSGAGNWDVWAVKVDAGGGIVWQRTFGGAAADLGWAVQATDDGGVILAGETGSFGGGADFWVVKLAANGAVDWQKRYGGAGVDIARALARTGDGGYLVAGETGSFGAGGRDIWLLRLTAAGGIAWQRSYGGPGDEIGFAVREIAGGVALAGSTTSFGAGGGDAWLLRLDAEGLIAGCALVGTTPAAAVDTGVAGANGNALTAATAAAAGPSAAAPVPRAGSLATQCSAPGPCHLDLAGAYGGGQLSLSYDLYSGPAPGTWQNLARIGGTWIPLWSVPLPPAFSYESTVSFNFPQVGPVPVISRLLTPAGPACADAVVVDTGP